MRADYLILDGRHLLYRTSDAFRELEAEVDGETIPTGGMYGFLNVATKIYGRYGGKVLVAWEGSGRNFRLDVMPSYKNRDKPPDTEKMEFISEMTAQERHLKRLLSLMGVRQYAGVCCEADDVIGRLTTELAARGRLVYIYSGDSDLRQLIREGSVWTVSPGTKQNGDKIYGPPEVMEKHGVAPELIPHLKALSGDASDAIPGVRGVGPKTAAQLISRFGSVAATLAAARTTGEWPVPERHRISIAEAGDKLYTYLKLATIDTACSMEAIPTAKRQAHVIEMLKQFKFRSLAGPAELYALMRMGGNG